MWMKSEDELVEDVLRGDQRSFELLLHPYRQGLLNMTYRLTGDLEEAKEICQEALIKIYRYIGKFKKERSFKSWIYKITVNSTYDFLRRKKKYEDLVESQKYSIARTGRGPEEQLLSKEIKAKIETCLQVLSPKEKIIECHFFFVSRRSKKNKLQVKWRLRDVKRKELNHFINEEERIPNLASSFY